MPGTVSVLETSGDTDEPPNLGGRTFPFFLLAVSLLVTRVPPASATLSLPPDTPFKLYLASLNILEYKHPLARGFAFIEVELSKSNDVSVQEATLGYSVSECQGPLLAQSPLNLTESEGEGVVTGVASLPLSLLQLEASGDKVDLCLQASVSRNKGPLFKTPWRLQRSLDLHQLKDDSQNPSPPLLSRQRRQDPSLSDPRVFSMLLARIDGKQSYTDDGVITVQEKNTFELELIGRKLNDIEAIRFTTLNLTYGERCSGGDAHLLSGEFADLRDGPHSGVRKLVVDGGLVYQSGHSVYYICVKDAAGVFRHQGDARSLQLILTTPLIPVWVAIILIVVLLCMSGLFSGLNLGLMSLDQTELKIVMNCGTDIEKAYAKAIMPIRGMGNFLLCSILLGNVLVNNTLTILLDNLTGGGGIVAVIGSTLGIVVFGEIIPQAICSRHGLAVGARTIWLTKFFMALTSPLSFPISKILDKILGSEIGTVYNKERLMELLKVTDQYNDLEKDEVKIVTGALVLKQKTVRDVMTNLDDCYMLPIHGVLDFETISEIRDQGYSRIPIYDEERSSIVHILFAKDLLFIDPDDCKPIEEICKFYKNEVNFVYQDTILTDMFDEFKSGEKGHLALVQEVNNEGEGDPFHETIGLVTLEDIIEEIIQQEIIDETDVIIDNKSKKKRKRERYKKDAEFKMFIGTKKQRVEVSPQMNLAILQYLTTSVKPFSPENISQRVLQKLLTMDVFRELKLVKKEGDHGKGVDDVKEVLMNKGKQCDFFIMIIEGKVEVTIGKEGKRFIEGPFSCFGEQMLEQCLALPPSPMVASQRGTSQSLSNNQDSGVGSGRVSSSGPPPLKKTDTRTSFGESKRSASAEGALPLPQASHSARQQCWIPDYSVRAMSDLMYLKVRRQTYLVAIKASRMNNMNSDSGGLKMNEEEISDVLAKVIENEDDEFGGTPSIRSPDKSWDGGGTMLTSNAGTPTEFRRESIRSSLSMMKQKFLGGQGGGRSNSSIDKTGQQIRPSDEFWGELGSTNPAMTKEGDDFGEKVAQIGSYAESHTNGPLSLPLNGSTKGGVGMKGETATTISRDMSEPMMSRGNNLPDVEMGGEVVGGGRAGNATVISVSGMQGGGGHGDGSPSDRTSLLNSDSHPVS